jgi:hypothetical protein
MQAFLLVEANQKYIGTLQIIQINTKVLEGYDTLAKYKDKIVILFIRGFIFIK